MVGTVDLGHISPGEQQGERRPRVDSRGPCTKQDGNYGRPRGEAEGPQAEGRQESGDHEQGNEGRVSRSDSLMGSTARKELTAGLGWRNLTFVPPC